jgi:polyprenyl-phospho-N-acetylgalactosaminyl synthase
MTVWVVVAAYNEGDRLEATLCALRRRQCEIVVVDDGSTDETGSVAAGLPVWTLRHPINCGQGAALRTGIAFALAHGADAIVTFDADGQHDDAEIDRVVAPIVEGRVDVVLGSRFLGGAIGMPRSRRVLTAAARLMTLAASGLRVSDPHNGLRAFSRRAAQQIRITQDRMAHASEIIDEIHAQGLRWCEVPVTVRYTSATLAKGQRSWSAFSIVGHLLAGKVIK